MKKKLVIGLTGPNASGKGEVARYLARKGFAYYSLSDIVREEAKKIDLKPTRENLIYVGNLLRKNLGPSILAKKIKPRLKGKNVVDSIRNVAEIKELKKIDNFILLGISAPVGLRFKRASKRKRTGESETLRRFIEKSNKIGYVEFLDEFANCRGYEILAKQQMMREGIKYE